MSAAAVVAAVVPAAGVEFARGEYARHAQSFGRDGRVYVAERVADTAAAPHDLIMLAVGPGAGPAVLELLREIFTVVDVSLPAVVA